LGVRLNLVSDENQDLFDHSLDPRAQSFLVQTICLASQPAHYRIELEKAI
jgi:hypothetical protein